MMKTRETLVLTLTEAGPPLRAALTTGQVAALVSLGNTVRIRPVGGGLWEIRGNQRVGMLQVGNGADRLEVRIRPKLLIDRLLHLMGVAGATGMWLEETLTTGRADQLETVIAQLFARTLTRALAQGVLHDYRPVEDDSSVVRGRIRTSAMLRRGGFPLPVPIAYDEFTADNNENRILRSAADRCLSLARLTDRTRYELLRLKDTLSPAVLLAVGEPPPRWTPGRLNERLQPALRLAELILQAAEPEPGNDGNVAMNGFIVDLQSVFERFITAGLQEALAKYGLSGVAQQSHRLDEARRLTIRPDMTIRQSGRIAAVVDAKYAELAVSRPSNEHIYQIVAYCIALGLQHGHLVYAAGAPATATHVVRTAGLSVTTHALNLNQPPRDIAAQIEGIAEQIAGAIR